MKRPPDLVLSTPPFAREAATTPGIMLEVLAAALLALVAACWFFGIGALLVVAAATAGAVGAEWLFTRSQAPSPVGDYSAVLTGVLLGLTLPPALPLWMAALGGVAGIGLGKLVWGGLGQNLFNPALVGRAFLQAAFPSAISTWSNPVQPGGFFTLPGGLFALPLMRADVDAVSAATPLGLAKFEHQLTDLGPLFLGQTTGSLGETSAALLLLCGVWLGARRLFDWRLPTSTLVSVAACAATLHLLYPDSYPPAAFSLLSGGLLFATVFMVTDPVTTPTTPRGAWIFGLGVGFLTVLIRRFGGLPEGVMYAILFMNALTPHINRTTQPRVFGV
ncbi:MAG: RnfABCDGE type electron transport complex subunit D [Myxococcota bacterium]